MTTLEQLRRRYNAPCLPLEQVAHDWLPHIRSQRHLITEIRAGRVGLRYTRLHSRKGRPVVYLDDLARWLDSQNPAAAPATQEASA